MAESKGRSTESTPEAAAEPSSPSAARPRRVEFYMRDGKHGYRRVAATGEIVQELPPAYDSHDEAVTAAKNDDTNEGLVITA